MRFSLIIGTLDREQQLEECITHLLAQTFQDFEIIIVDQSTQENIHIAQRSEKITYMHVDYKGLSRARNDALKIAAGDYICLVDDDGLYETDVLEKADAILRQEAPTIMGGRMIDPQSGESACNVPRAIVHWRTAFSYMCSPTMIIERDFLCTHLFDECFGVGTEYGSGEETDIIFAALAEKKKVLYTDKYTVSHPLHRGDTLECARIMKYAYGQGALLAKVKKSYSWFWGTVLFYKAFLGNEVAALVLWILRKKSARLRRIKAKKLFLGFKAYLHED